MENKSNIYLFDELVDKHRELSYEECNEITATLFNKLDHFMSDFDSFSNTKTTHEVINDAYVIVNMIAPTQFKEEYPYIINIILTKLIAKIYRLYFTHWKFEYHNSEETDDDDLLQYYEDIEAFINEFNDKFIKNKQIESIKSPDGWCCFYNEMSFAF